MNTPKRYHPILVTLHWLTVIFILGAGLLSEEGGDSPINLHMIFGAILLVVMTARLITRFSTKRPAPLDAGNPFFNKIGQLTHPGLYAAAFGILGLGGAIAVKRNLFGYLVDSSAQISRAGFIGDLHHLLYLMTMALIFLHIGAAFYHQFILKDNIFSRMWYGK
ncbi:MAG: cytochrome b [Anaerolineales bacterium]